MNGLNSLWRLPVGPGGRIVTGIAASSATAVAAARSKVFDRSYGPLADANEITTAAAALSFIAQWNNTFRPHGVPAVLDSVLSSRTDADVFGGRASGDFGFIKVDDETVMPPFTDISAAAALPAEAAPRHGHLQPGSCGGAYSDSRGSTAAPALRYCGAAAQPLASASSSQVEVDPPRPAFQVEVPPAAADISLMLCAPLGGVGSPSAQLQRSSSKRAASGGGSSRVSSSHSLLALRGSPGSFGGGGSDDDEENEDGASQPSARRRKSECGDTHTTSASPSVFDLGGSDDAFGGGGGSPRGVFTAAAAASPSPRPGHLQPGSGGGRGENGENHGDENAATSFRILLESLLEAANTIPPPLSATLLSTAAHPSARSSVVEGGLSEATMSGDAGIANIGAAAVSSIDGLAAIAVQSGVPDGIILALEKLDISRAELLAVSAPGATAGALVFSSFEFTKQLLVEQHQLFPFGLTSLRLSSDAAAPLSSSSSSLSLSSSSSPSSLCPPLSIAAATAADASTTLPAPPSVESHAHSGVHASSSATTSSVTSASPTREVASSINDRGSVSSFTSGDHIMSNSDAACSSSSSSAAAAAASVYHISAVAYGAVVEAAAITPASATASVAAYNADVARQIRNTLAKATACIKAPALDEIERSVISLIDGDSNAKDAAVGALRRQKRKGDLLFTYS